MTKRRKGAQRTVPPQRSEKLAASGSAYAHVVVRRAGPYRVLDSGVRENGRRDFRRELTALWASEGKRLTGRQWRKARQADRRSEKAAA